MPELARQAESGNLAVAAGVVSLVRAVRAFSRGDRRRGATRALGGLFWVGVALAQRRSGERSGTAVSDVVTTSPDVESAVDPGDRETDHATGETVVDTTNADVEAADTAPEVGVSPEVEDAVGEGAVDQRDVAGSDTIADEEGEFSESGDAETRETGEYEDGESA